MHLARPYLTFIISTMSSTEVTSARLPAKTSQPVDRPSRADRLALFNRWRTPQRPRFEREHAARGMIWDSRLLPECLVAKCISCCVIDTRALEVSLNSFFRNLPKVARIKLRNSKAHEPERSEDLMSKIAAE
jgi:hypothetical protein